MPRVRPALRLLRLERLRAAPPDGAVTSAGRGGASGQAKPRPRAATGRSARTFPRPAARVSWLVLYQH
jgi:hypothetical protein